MQAWREIADMDRNPAEYGAITPLQRQKRFPFLTKLRAKLGLSLNQMAQVVTVATEELDPRVTKIVNYGVNAMLARRNERLANTAQAKLDAAENINWSE